VQNIHKRSKQRRALMSVLIIDDSPSSVQPLIFALKHMKIEVDYTYNEFVGLEWLITNSYELVIIDWSMPDIGGQKLLLQADIARFLSGEHDEADSAKYVIYSSYQKEQIDLPFTVYFQPIDHWHKGSNIPELCQKTKKLLNV
jgi:CheY-like chemotaxis protein